MGDRTDPLERAVELRKTLTDGSNNILVARFEETLEGKDTSKSLETMPITRTGEKVFRAKHNVKDIDPLAAKAYGKQFVDISKMSNDDIEEFVKRQEFDFPLWFKHHPKFTMKRILDYNPPFVFQVAGCNFHDGSACGGCWYCFVDNELNDGVINKGKAKLRINDAVNSFLSARKIWNDLYKKNGIDLNISVLRASGGEPMIVLDWILNLWGYIDRATHYRGPEIVGQIDTNLSTGPFIDQMERDGVFRPNSLERLAAHPIKVLCAIKGTDQTCLCDNVQSNTSMQLQEYSLKKIIGAGLDSFIQIYNPNPETLRAFLEDMDSKIENFSLKAHIGPLKIYSPTTLRLTKEAERLKVDPALFIQRTKEKWAENYRLGCEITDKYLRETHGVGYKDVVRSDVALKVK